MTESDAVDGARRADPGGSRSSEPPEAASGWKKELKQTLAVGEAVMETLGDSAELLRLEAMLAASRVPKVIAAWLLTLPTLFLAWVSFCAMSAWAVFEWLGEPLAAFACFFLLQLLSLFGLSMYLRYNRKLMQFQRSRQNLEQLLETIRSQLKPEGDGPERNDPQKGQNREVRE